MVGASPVTLYDFQSVPCAVLCGVQTEATYWGSPTVEGFDLEASLTAVDLVPLMSSPPDGQVERLTTTVDGAPVKMKLTGVTRMSARRNSSGQQKRQQLGTTKTQVEDEAFLFTGRLIIPQTAAAAAAVVIRIEGMHLKEHVTRHVPGCNPTIKMADLCFTWLCRSSGL